MKTENESPEEIKDEPYHDEGQIDPNLKEKIKLTGHQWVQQGPWLVCKSCPIRHGTYIGINKILIGIDSKGYPKFARCP